MIALVVILACLLAGLLATALVWTVQVKRVERCDTLDAARLTAVRHSLSAPIVHYSTIRTPEAMRALAAEIAEQADRIEARHAYRGGAA